MEVFLGDSSDSVSSGSSGSVVISSTMGDSSSDVQEILPAGAQDGLNTQGMGHTDSDHSSGIGTASSGQLEATSITSDILFGNREGGSLGSSDIQIVPLLHFDALADAISATTTTSTTPPSTSTTTQSTASKNPFIITASMTSDNTVNEDDVKRKIARPPASRPSSGPPLVLPENTTNPFSFGNPTTLALTWPKPASSPPPAIIPRGISMVPYAQVEVVNNRLNSICGERDSLKEELQTQIVEVQKQRDNNRVLLGENLMLKQQQSQLLELIDKKTLVIQVFKKHMELLEMINSTNRSNKNTKDAATVVSPSELPAQQVTETQTKFEQMRQNITDDAMDEKTAMDACDAVVDSVIQECSSSTVGLADTRTESLTGPDGPNATAMQGDVSDVAMCKVTRDQAEDLANSVIAKVLQDLASDTETDRTGRSKSLGDKMNSEQVKSATFPCDQIEKQAALLVNSVIRAALQDFSSSTEHSINLKNESQMYAANHDVFKHTACKSTDISVRQKQACGTATEANGNVVSRVCVTCGHVLRSAKFQEMPSDFDMPEIQGNVGKATFKHSAEAFAASISREPADGEPLAWSGNFVLDSIEGDMKGKTRMEAKIRCIVEEETTVDESVSDGDVNCLVEDDEQAPCRISASDACTQTQPDDHRPFNSRSTSRIRDFICCRR